MTAATEHAWRIGDRIQVLPDAWDGDVGVVYNARIGIVLAGARWGDTPFLLVSLGPRKWRAKKEHTRPVYLPLNKVRPA